MSTDKGEKGLASKILSIVMENGGLSIGRTLVLSMFVMAMIQWGRGVELPSSQVTIIMVLLGYVLGSKVVGNVSETVGKVMETKKAITEVIEQKNKK